MKYTAFLLCFMAAPLWARYPSPHIPFAEGRGNFSQKLGNTVWHSGGRLLIFDAFGQKVALADAALTKAPPGGEFAFIFKAEERSNNLWLLRVESRYMALRLLDGQRLLSSEGPFPQRLVSNVASSHRSFDVVEWRLSR